MLVHRSGRTIVKEIVCDRNSNPSTTCQLHFGYLFNSDRISVICLVIIACLSTCSAIIPDLFLNCNNTNGNTENVCQSLHVAEKMIESVKEKLSKTMPEFKPTDCEDLLKYGAKKSGVYLVWPKSRVLSGPISVYCDMVTDGGGWTVLLRRGDFPRENDYFNQDWKAYKEGFGNLKQDFWLGNDNIYALSNQKLYSVRFDLGAFDGSKAQAIYSKFWINDEYNNYRLHVSGYSGTAGDSFKHHNACMFSTRDRDNDNSSTHCAQTKKGAWWFNACQYCYLTGEYYRVTPWTDYLGIIWSTWKDTTPLATAEMKIRETSSWIK